MPNVNHDHSSAKFRSELTKRSDSLEWKYAKKEWDPDTIILSQRLSQLYLTHFKDVERSKIILPTSEYCICGQNIIECRIIINKITGKRIVIGNKCVRHIGTDKLNDIVSKQGSSMFKEAQLLAIYYNKPQIKKFNQEIPKINYIDSFKKIPSKNIDFMLNEGLIDQDECDYLNNISTNYKHNNNIKLTLHELEKVVAFKQKTLDYVHKDKKIYDIENIIFDNTNEQLILDYAKKYNIIHNNHINKNYFIFVDRLNHVIVKLAVPNPQLNYYAKHSLDIDNMKYERGFIHFSWKTNKIIKSCHKCKFMFYCASNEYWKNTCISCYFPNVKHKHNFSKDEYNVLGNYTCSVCNQKHTYNKIKSEIVDIDNIMCKSCWKDDPKQFPVYNDYIICVDKTNKSQNDSASDEEDDDN
jgi:hypothetical protein